MHWSPGSGRRAPKGSSAAAQCRVFLEALDKPSLSNPETLQQKQLHAICSINMQASQDVPELLPAAEAPQCGGELRWRPCRPSRCQLCRRQLPGKPGCRAGHGEGWTHGHCLGAAETTRLHCCSHGLCGEVMGLWPVGCPISIPAAGQGCGTAWSGEHQPWQDAGRAWGWSCSGCALLRQAQQPRKLALPWTTWGTKRLDSDREPTPAQAAPTGLFSTGKSDRRLTRVPMVAAGKASSSFYPSALHVWALPGSL